MIKLIVFLLLFLPALARATTGVPEAYSVIAKEYDIPPEILYSIALTESYRGDIKRPWPWTVNCQGEGSYFNTKSEAFNFVTSQLSQGINNCDIGIMEVNWRWHKSIFESLWSAFDPYTNIRAGASILSQLYRKHGSYEVAIGAYHSPGNIKLADAYKERVRKHLRRVLTGAV